MNNFKFSFGVTVCIIVSIYFSIGDALKCYRCNSAYEDEKNCTDVKKGWTDYVHDCDSSNDTYGATVCRITVIFAIDAHENKTLKDLGLESRVVRGCGKEARKGKAECYKTGGKGSKTETCECKTDLCNHSYKTSVSSPLFVTLIIYAVFSAIL